LNQFPGDDIGINHGDAVISEEPGDSAFATPYPACETDDEHEL
jgi:hypothetical protein